MGFKKPLTKKQTEMLVMLFEGATDSDVAKAFNVNRGTVHALKERDDAVRLQQKHINNIFGSAVAKAAKKLVEQLDDPNPWVAQQASRTILEHYNKGNEKADKSVVVLFDNMPAPPVALPDPSVVEGDGEVQ